MATLKPWNRRTGLGGCHTAYFYYSGLEIVKHPFYAGFKSSAISADEYKVKRYRILR